MIYRAIISHLSRNSLILLRDQQQQQQQQKTKTKTKTKTKKCGMSSMGHRKKMTVAAIAIRGNNVRDSPSRAT